MAKDHLRGDSSTGLHALFRKRHGSPTNRCLAPGSGTEKGRDLAAAPVRIGLHPAVPFKDHTLIDDENGRLDVTDHPSWSMDFDFSAGDYIPADLATDNNVRGFDIRFNDRRLSNDEGPFARDLTLETTVNPDGATEGQPSREFRIVP